LIGILRTEINQGDRNVSRSFTITVSETNIDSDFMLIILSSSEEIFKFGFDFEMIKYFILQGANLLPDDHSYSKTLSPSNSLARTSEISMQECENIVRNLSKNQNKNFPVLK
jgi:hypothetical protein